MAASLAALNSALSAPNIIVSPFVLGAAKVGAVAETGGGGDGAGAMAGGATGARTATCGGAAGTMGAGGGLAGVVGVGTAVERTAAFAAF